MDPGSMTRRSVLKGGGAAVAGWSVLQLTGSQSALAAAGGDDFNWLGHDGTLRETYPGRPGDEPLEWSDQPDPVPPPAQGVVGNLLDWEALSTRLTPADNFFTVKHYEVPDINPNDWRLSITGLVAHEMSISLADLMARPRRDGRVHTRVLRQHRSPVLHRRHRKCGVGWCRVGSAVAAGTAARPGNRSRVLGNRLRHRRDPRQQWRPQRREHGRRGTGRRWWPRHHDHRAVRQEHDACGRDGAGQPAVLRDERRAAAYQSTGHPCVSSRRVGTASPTSSGSRGSRSPITASPVASWPATTSRSVSTPTMPATRSGRSRTSAPRRLKSAPAKVVHNGGSYRVIGVAWGDAISQVDVSIDGGPPQPAQLVGASRHGGRSSGVAWRFWSYDWGTPSAGEHTVASLAISKDGDVQPTQDDPIIADKRTYWESNGEITRTVVIP